jgi:hypothetical protein
VTVAGDENRVRSINSKFQDENGMTVSFTDVDVMPALAVFLSTSLSLIKAPMAPLVLSILDKIFPTGPS